MEELNCCPNCKGPTENTEYGHIICIGHCGPNGERLSWSIEDLWNTRASVSHADLQAVVKETKDLQAKHDKHGNFPEFWALETVINQLEILLKPQTNKEA